MRTRTVHVAPVVAAIAVGALTACGTVVSDQGTVGDQGATGRVAAEIVGAPVEDWGAMPAIQVRSESSVDLSTVQTWASWGAAAVEVTVVSESLEPMPAAGASTESVEPSDGEGEMLRNLDVVVNQVTWVSPYAITTVKPGDQLSFLAYGYMVVDGEKRRVEDGTEWMEVGASYGMVLADSYEDGKQVLVPLNESIRGDGGRAALDMGSELRQETPDRELAAQPGESLADRIGRALGFESHGEKAVLARN